VFIIYVSGVMRASAGRQCSRRVGPSHPACWGGGPRTGTASGSGQPGHGALRAVPCLGRAKTTCFRAGRQPNRPNAHLYLQLETGGDHNNK
jgi:hypothetical protein